MSNPTKLELQLLAQSQVNNYQQQQRQQVLDQYNQWADQQAMDALRAEYEAWNAANPLQPEAQQPEVQQPVQDVQPAQEVQSVQTKPAKKTTKPATQEIPQPLEDTKPKNSKYNFRANYAGPREETEQPKQEEKTLDKKDLLTKSIVNTLNSKDFKDQVNRGKAAKLKEQRGTKSENAINTSVNQLDLSDIQAKMDKAKEQQSEDLERQILNSDRYVPDNSIPQLTDDQKALEDQIANFDEYQINDTSKGQEQLAAFGWGLSKIPFFVSGLLANGAVDVGETLGQAGAIALDDFTGNTNHENLQKVNEYWDNKRAQVEDNAQWMRDSQRQAGEEHPFAYGAGKLGTQAALYAVTNPLFDKIGGAIGAGASKLASALGASEKAAKVAGKVVNFLGNQVGQNLQDVALDTTPEYFELKELGYSDDEIKDILSKNVRNNAIGNGIFGTIGEIPGLVKYINGKKVPAPQLEDVDNVVRNAARQTENAAQNIDDAAKQIPSIDMSDAAKNIEVDTSGARPYALNQGVSPSIENEADEIIKYNEGLKAAEDNAITPVREAAEDIPQEVAKTTPEYSAPKYSVDSGVDNPNLSYDANDEINSYLFQLEEPFNDRKVQIEVGELYDKVRSHDGFMLIDEYGELCNDLRQSADDIPEVRERLVELRKGINSVDASERETIKDLMDFADIETAISDYQKALNGTDMEAVDRAAKNLDAARNRVARRKNADPVLKEAFGGSYGPIVNRPKNTFSIEPDVDTDEFIKELADYDNNNPNRYVRDAEPETQTPYRAPQEAEVNKVIAEDTGIPKQEGSYRIEDIPENAPVNTSEIVPPEGEMKESGLSRHIRNDGTPMKMEGVSDEVIADFEDNPGMYKVLRNADTKAKAEKIYAESANPEVEFRDMLRNHDPASLPLGHQLAKDYSAAGNHEAAAQIYREMEEQLTKAGQFSQAAAINMMKNDPLTALEYVQREIDNLNQKGAKRFKNWKNFSLTDDEIKMFNNIAPGDEEAIKAAFDTIGERLGKEYPTTLMDKVLEGRKIAMLFNLRTNVRNFGANVPTLAMRWTADRLEAVGQNIAHIIDPDVEVTQAIRGSGRQGRELATEVFNSKKVQSMLENQSGKYEVPDLKSSIVKNKQMYKGTFVSKWIDDVTGGGIQKVNEKLFGKKGVQSGLETVRNATYKMLDLGDSPFVRENFVERLGSYIRAKGITNIDDIPEEAIQLAYEEAMKATYKDNSWAVQMLSGFKGGMEKIPGIGRPLSQAAIPFLQAPGNIAARMIDYSPVKASKGIGDIIAGAGRSDAKQITKGIEEAAKGLTGTGLIILGMKLRDSGIITGTYSDDKDQKAFEKQNGFKEFALHIGDKYFTYDWAQPFAEPLIIGTLLSDAINKSDEYDSDLLAYVDNTFGTNLNGSAASKALGVAYEGGKASLNSWFNASPLQGLQELLSGGYNSTDIAQNLVDTGVSDFFGGFVPSMLNATAKSVDTTQRNTYDPSSRTGTFINQQIAKIPGLSDNLPAKYDTWGREMKYADSQAMATASRFVIPGDYSYDKAEPVDNEVNRLYESTNNVSVFPQVAPNKVGDKKLNNKEVSEYQKDMGQRSKILADSFISSDFYQSMNDADRAETLSKLYGLSKAITERDKFGKEMADSSEYRKPAEIFDEAGGGEKGADAVLRYYQAKNIANQYDISSSSNAYKEIQQAALDGNIEEAQKLAADTAQTNQILEDAGLSKNTNAAKEVAAAVESGDTAKAEKLAEQGVKDQEAKKNKQKTSEGKTETIADYGLTSSNAKATYSHANKILTISPKTFASTYKEIDSDKSQGLSQAEIIDYMNNKKLSESTGMKIWNAYGNSKWKKIPSLEDGKWVLKKK